jgi:hypothetical protein
VIKRCCGCKNDKSIEDFAINRSKSDGRATMCKACKKAYNQAYYAVTRDRHKPGRAASRILARESAQRNVHEYLRSHPCIDCGETDIVVLEFDHLRDKKFGISDMINAGMRWPRILAEIEKCDVVCANDHRRRTATTFGWRKAIAVAA